MRRILTLFLLVTLTSLLLPRSIRAQNSTRLDTLEINLWPEYDRSSMLVMYIGGLPDNSWPVSLTFHIPVTPTEIAVRTVDGGLYKTPYTSTPQNGYYEVTFQATTQNFQIEYYDKLDFNGIARSYHYTWPGDYAVKNAAIVVQQPIDASHMQFVPDDKVSSTINSNNLVIYNHPFGPLTAGQTYAYSLSYQKPNNTLTADKLNVRIAGELPKSMWTRTLPWAFGFVALLVIAGGVWFFWRSGLPEVGDKKRRRRKAAATMAVAEAASEDDSGVYCHRCGRRAALNDVFCRSCGTKLRL